MTLFRVKPFSEGAWGLLEQMVKNKGAEQEEDAKEDPPCQPWQKEALPPSCSISWQGSMASTLPWEGWWLCHQHYYMASQLCGIRAWLCAVRPGNSRPIYSRYLMAIPLHKMPASLHITRMPTHCVLASSSIGHSLQVMGFALAFLLCTWEPWLCFGLLEVMRIYRET